MTVGAMYKYEEIVKDIEGQIANGTLKPYEKLPTVTELCDTYNVSKSTITQVLQMLSDDGVISRRQGSGIYIKAIETSSIGWKSTNQVVQVASRSAKMPDQDGISVLDLTVQKPEASIIRALSLKNQTFLYSITRLHKNGNLPICIEYAYLPIEAVGSINIEMAAGNLSEAVAKTTGIPIASYQKTVRSVTPTNEERAYLKIEYGTPLLEVEEVGYLADGKPFGVYVKHFPGDRFEFKAGGTEADQNEQQHRL